MNLKQIRKQKQYTQEQMAKIINVERSYYSRIENNKTVITGNQIIKLCKAMNISADYLLGLIDNPNELRKD